MAAPSSAGAHAWFNVVGHERMQRGRGGVGERRHTAPAHPFRLADLDRHASQDLLAPSPATGQVWLHTTDVGLVHLHHPGQPSPPWTYPHRAESMQHRPRRLIGTDFQRPFQAQRRNPVLAAGEQPGGVEPNRQRRSRTVEDRARGRRGTAPAPGAHQSAVAEAPRCLVATHQACEARRPPQPLQVVQAVLVALEPLRVPSLSADSRISSGCVAGRISFCPAVAPSDTFTHRRSRRCGLSTTIIWLQARSAAHSTVVSFRNSVWPWSERWPNSAVPRW